MDVNVKGSFVSRDTRKIFDFRSLRAEKSIVWTILGKDTDDLFHFPRNRLPKYDQLHQWQGFKILETNPRVFCKWSSKRPEWCNEQTDTLQSFSASVLWFAPPSQDRKFDCGTWGDPWRHPKFEGKFNVSAWPMITLSPVTQLELHTVKQFNGWDQKNQSRLPEPVGQLQGRLYLLTRLGIHLAWTSVIEVKPISAIAFLLGSDKSRSQKVVRDEVLVINSLGFFGDSEVPSNGRLSKEENSVPVILGKIWTGIGNWPG